MRKEIEKILTDAVSMDILKDEAIDKLLALFSVNSMADKAQMINALTNTMAVNKQLGDYISLKSKSLEKLEKLIDSINVTL